MKARFTALKGAPDVLPPETHLWSKIENAACEVFCAYGYDEIKTPILEPAELFLRSIGSSSDIVAKEMYSFTDKADRSISLRPEGTAGVVRAYVEHNLSLRPAPQKFFYRGPMFRYERPQKGRQRQFYQIGAECFGTAHPGMDAELIVMLMAFLEKAGLRGFSLELNSIGCRQCRPAFKQRLKEFFGPHLDVLCPDCQRRYEQNPLRILDCKVERCSAVRAGAPLISESLCEDCRMHFGTLLGLLDAMETPYTLNPQMVRGLDYYTRTVFEVTSGQLGAQNAVAAGGRYDLLVSEFGGPETPALGFAAGMERLSDIILSATASGQAGPEVFIASVGGEAAAAALKTASALRAGGKRVEVGWEGSLKSQLRRADKMGAGHVVIIGGDELKSGSFKWKNLKNGESGETAAGEIFKLFI
ncbi:MAG: histidine--tRNA ligase [Nitrospiraceae bacterium]|nr:histidine--tRNA ligase [Nitrospiraceae bacterium]